MAHKLLLADDSITIQKVVSLTFADEDFDIVCVGNGELAVEKLREMSPDVVLADIFMPRKTGYEVCEFVKNSPRLNHVPVILLVGAFEPFDKNEAARVGADFHLTKPFETTALIKMVRNALASKKPSLPKLADTGGDDLLQTLHAVMPVRPHVSKTGDVPFLTRQSTADILEMPLIKPMKIQEMDFEKTILATRVNTGSPFLEPDEVFLPLGEDTLLDLAEDARSDAPFTPMPPPPPELLPAMSADKPEHSARPAMAEDRGMTTAVSAAKGGRLDERGAPDGESEDVFEICAVQSTARSSADEDILGVSELLVAEMPPVQRAAHAAHVETPVPPNEVKPVPALPDEGGTDTPRPGATASERGAPAAAGGAPPAEAERAPAHLDDAFVEKVARLVVEKLSDRVLREIAWEVVPDLAELIIRQATSQLKGRASG